MNGLMQVPTKSLTVLSSIWFALCASLVAKQNELIVVFFAFVGCFVLAYGLSQITAMTAEEHLLKKQEKQRTNDKVGMNKAITPTKEMRTKDFIMRHRHMRVRDNVGMLVCVVSSLSGRFDVVLSDSVQGDFLAVSILAGYLAFDLWYTSSHSRTIPLLSFLTDTASLIAAVVSLSLIGDRLEPYRAWVQVWTGYRLVLLTQRLWTSSDLTTSVTIKPTATAQPVKAKQAANAVASSSSSSTATTVRKKDPSELWVVHGGQYDLEKYIDHHPGGKEALLLGRGRDCTAMFESYHPFTNKHREVLKKYRVTDVYTTATGTPSKGNTRIESSKANDKISSDPFYDILKDRVAAELKAQGFDPNKDRTAPLLRILYYCVVVVGLVLSAYHHAHVSFDFHGTVLSSLIVGWIRPFFQIVTLMMIAFFLVLLCGGHTHIYPIIPFCPYSITMTGQSTRFVLVWGLWLVLWCPRTRRGTLCHKSPRLDQRLGCVGHVLALQSDDVATPAYLCAS